MTKIQLTQELVRELFDYKDGFLYWKVKPARRVKIGDIAGSFIPNKNRNNEIRCKVFIKGNNIQCYTVHTKVIFMLRILVKSFSKP